MRIKQLGNGGGLDPLATNSSFLIDVSNEIDETSYILFDCGHNIMRKLIELEEEGVIKIEDIKHVFISHLHDDHVGNLETLIYYQYFKNNVVMNVYSGEGIENKLRCKISELNFLYDNGKNVSIILAKYIVIDDTYCVIHPDISHIQMTSVKGYHGNSQSYGLILVDNETQFKIFISGDTRGYSDIEKKVNSIVNQYDKRCLLFHDFSEWDCPEKNVHMCDTNMNEEYSPEFINNLLFYHTNKKFNSDWIEVANN
jgi:ribonuclease BN (tRNA processing enzyme)